jgi:hypothetical protein
MHLFSFSLHSIRVNVQRSSLIILFVLIWGNSFAQDAITIKYFGLTVHPAGDKTAHLQPNKLDKNARFVVNTGVFLGYEKFVYQDIISVKFIQGLLSDCSNGFASVSHIGVRARLFQTPKFRFYVGAGPALLVRDSWHRFGEAYTSSGYFNEAYSERFGEIQWKFAPIAIELEYDYVFNPRNQLSLSFTPGIPTAMLFSIGWKHWLHVKEFDQSKPYLPKKRKKSRTKIK